MCNVWWCVFTLPKSKVARECRLNLFRIVKMTGIIIASWKWAILFAVTVCLHAFSAETLWWPLLNFIYQFRALVSFSANIKSIKTINENADPKNIREKHVYFIYNNNRNWELGLKISDDILGTLQPLSIIL